jgi:hypothetical protein
MRLPEKYRAPIVLCYFEGLTHEGAARLLGWPVGTVRGRLARARDLLRNRLTRRGVTATAELGAVGCLARAARAAVPDGLRDATVQAAIRIVYGQSIASVATVNVRALAEGVISLTGVSCWKSLMGLVLVLCASGIGIALALAGSTPPGQDRQAQAFTPPVLREDRSANLRAMLQLKGTWASPQSVTYNIVGVPQPPKSLQVDLLD